MKVVIPVGSLQTGGGCQVLVDTAHALVRKGHDAQIVIPEGMPIDYPLHCRLTTIPSLSKEYIPYGDLVLPNFYTTVFPSYEAWPDQCVRFSLGFEPYWVPNPKEALASYRCNMPLLSISNWLDRQIFQNTGRRSRVIHLGVDPAIFYPEKKQKTRSSDGKKVILYIARNPHSGYRIKGYDDFIQSMEIVQKVYRGAYIVHLVCTEVELNPSHIPHKIFRPRSLQEMAQLYRSSDLFVSTSWFEGFSLPPLEAMACGIPVVTTNSGGVLDYCQHLKNSFIATPKNPHSIASGILTLLSHEQAANRLGLQGPLTAKKMTKKHFEEKIVSLLETIYLEKRRKIRIRKGER